MLTEYDIRVRTTSDTNGVAESSASRRPARAGYLPARNMARQGTPCVPLSRPAPPSSTQASVAEFRRRQTLDPDAMQASARHRRTEVVNGPVRKGGNRPVAGVLKSPLPDFEPATPSLPWRSRHRGDSIPDLQNRCAATHHVAMAGRSGTTRVASPSPCRKAFAGSTARPGRRAVGRPAVGPSGRCFCTPPHTSVSRPAPWSCAHDLRLPPSRSLRDHMPVPLSCRWACSRQRGAT